MNGTRPGRFSLRAFRLVFLRTRGLGDQRPCPWACRLEAPRPPLEPAFYLKSLILNCALIRLGRLFAAGFVPRPPFSRQLSKVFCSGSGRALRWVGVPFWPKWAWHSGCVQILIQSVFAISISSYKIGVPPRRKVHFWSVGLSLGGSQAPLGDPFGAMDVTKPYEFNRVWGHGCHQTL